MTIEDETVECEYATEFICNDYFRSYRKTPLTEAEALVASGDAILYDTQEDLDAAIAYQSNRRDNYPAIGEQLDSLYHEIIVSGSLTSSGSWAQSIRAVKDAHPKPE